MKKLKHKIKKLHKTKVHHNRWLAWAVSYCLVVAIALLGFLSVSDLNWESELLAESRYEPWKVYSNGNLGFAISYPSYWSLERVSPESVTIQPPDISKEGVSVSVMESENRAALRRGLAIVDESEIIVDEMVGTRITNRLSSTASEAVVMVERRNKLYVVRGPQMLVDQFILTFDFL